MNSDTQFFLPKNFRVAPSANAAPPSNRAVLPASGTLIVGKGISADTVWVVATANRSIEMTLMVFNIGLIVN